MEYHWTDIVNLSYVNGAYNNFFNNMCCPLRKMQKQRKEKQGMDDKRTCECMEEKVNVV